MRNLLQYVGRLEKIKIKSIFDKIVAHPRKRGTVNDVFLLKRELSPTCGSISFFGHITRYNFGVSWKGCINKASGQMSDVFQLELTPQDKNKKA